MDGGREIILPARRFRLDQTDAILEFGKLQAVAGSKLEDILRIAQHPFDEVERQIEVIGLV